MHHVGPVDWYFDFISPFAYLQCRALETYLRDNHTLKIRCKPVLFAALLAHNEHKGPAEIPSKRLATYRFCHWFADRHGIPFNMPAAHPFNPLPFLRLAIARDCRFSVISRLFQYIWVESANNPEFHNIEAISRVSGFKDAEDEVGHPAVKEKLRQNTDEAVTRGVFGVPTLVVGNWLFWGLDMTHMAMEYLEHPETFNQDAYDRIYTLPIAKARS